MFAFLKSNPNKPSQREFYSLKNAHKIPCLGRYVNEDDLAIS